jgi:hypothetical protein
LKSYEVFKFEGLDYKIVAARFEFISKLGG